MFPAMESLTGGGGMSAGGGGPSNSGPLSGTSSFDSSGWNVNFGSGGIESSRSDALTGYAPYILGGLALLVVWRMTRKR